MYFYVEYWTIILDTIWIWLPYKYIIQYELKLKIFVSTSTRTCMFRINTIKNYFTRVYTCASGLKPINLINTRFSKARRQLIKIAFQRISVNTNKPSKLSRLSFTQHGTPDRQLWYSHTSQANRLLKMYTAVYVLLLKSSYIIHVWINP